MKLEFDICQISEETLRRIAIDAENIELIEQLAQCPYYSVIKILIEKPETTKEIRGKIYAEWHGRRDMRDMANYPLDATTIHWLTQTCDGEPDLCKLLVTQEDIELENIKYICDLLMAGDSIEEQVVEVLSVIAERQDLEEELMQKLVDYSPEVAAQVALHHSDLIRVDFSKRQTE